jgi:hypothetical protein
MFDNQDGFPFMVGGRTESIVHCHPSTIHIFQLWQIYIDNINPLLKITHVPSVQGQVIEATTNLEKAPKNIEALMFGMYVMAISSLDDGEVQRRFNQGKKDLLARFFPALQQALVNASFMRVNDSICLQALLLYLVSTSSRAPALVHLANVTPLACRPLVRRSAPGFLLDWNSGPYCPKNGPP